MHNLARDALSRAVCLLALSQWCGMSKEVSKMRALFLAGVLALSFAGVASAQEAPATTSPTWADVQRACGTEYRDAKTNANRPSWPDFLNECKVRKGFVPKRAGKVEFRLPDVQKQ
jgi:hypothetical protein